MKKSILDIKSEKLLVLIEAERIVTLILQHFLSRQREGMGPLVSSFLTDGNSIGFFTLVVFLLLWVMKQNDLREERYEKALQSIKGQKRKGN